MALWPLRVEYKPEWESSDKVSDEDKLTPSRVAAQGHVSSTAAAEILGVSRRSVQVWVESGILSAWKTPGGHRRILLNSILALKSQRQKTAPSTRVGQKDRQRLLVLDDDFEAWKVYRDCFDRLAVPVDAHISSDGFEGLIMLGDLKPDWLITDLRLPPQGVVNMIESVRNHRHLEVNGIIVTTSLAGSESEIQLLRQLNVPVVYKPLRLEQLQAALAGVGCGAPGLTNGAS